MFQAGVRGHTDRGSSHAWALCTALNVGTSVRVRAGRGGRDRGTPDHIGGNCHQIRLHCRVERRICRQCDKPDGSASPRLAFRFLCRLRHPWSAAHNIEHCKSNRSSLPQHTQASTTAFSLLMT